MQIPTSVQFRPPNQIPSLTSPFDGLLFFVFCDPQTYPVRWICVHLATHAGASLLHIPARAGKAKTTVTPVSLADRPRARGKRNGPLRLRPPHRGPAPPKAPRRAAPELRRRRRAPLHVPLLLHAAPPRPALLARPHRPAAPRQRLLPLRVRRTRRAQPRRRRGAEARGAPRRAGRHPARGQVDGGRRLRQRGQPPRAGQGARARRRGARRGGGDRGGARRVGGRGEARVGGALADPHARAGRARPAVRLPVRGRAGVRACGVPGARWRRRRRAAATCVHLPVQRRPKGSYDQISDAGIVHDSEPQPEAAVLAEHPARRRRRAGTARPAEGLDGNHPRPVRLSRGGGVHGHPVRAVPGLRPRLPRQPGSLAHPPAHRRRGVQLEAVGAPGGVARARPRRRPRLPSRAGLRLGPRRVRRPHRRVVHQHQARRAVRDRPGHVPRGRRRRRVAVRRRVRDGVHGGGRREGEPAHRAGRRAARGVHGRRGRVRRAVRGGRSLHGRMQALLVKAQEGAVPGPRRLVLRFMDLGSTHQVFSSFLWK